MRDDFNPLSKYLDIFDVCYYATPLLEAAVSEGGVGFERETPKDRPLYVETNSSSAPYAKHEINNCISSALSKSGITLDGCDISELRSAFLGQWDVSREAMKKVGEIIEFLRTPEGREIVGATRWNKIRNVMRDPREWQIREMASPAAKYFGIEEAKSGRKTASYIVDSIAISSKHRRRGKMLEAFARGFPGVMPMVEYGKAFPDLVERATANAVASEKKSLIPFIFCANSFMSDIFSRPGVSQMTPSISLGLSVYGEEYPRLLVLGGNPEGDMNVGGYEIGMDSEGNPVAFEKLYREHAVSIPLEALSFISDSVIGEAVIEREEEATMETPRSRDGDTLRTSHDEFDAGVRKNGTNTSEHDVFDEEITR